MSRFSIRQTSTEARVAPECLLMFCSSSETVKYAIPSIAGAGRAGRSTSTCTGTVHRDATADNAASRPRSVRTAGWIPRARSRSS